MIKRRRRFKQTTTLAHRLNEQAGRLRDRAGQLPPGAEQNTLWRKVRQTETALRIDEILSSPQSVAPGDVMTLVDDKRPRKRSVKSEQSSAS